MKEVKVLIDDDVDFVSLTAYILDVEGFTVNTVRRIYSVSKDVFDMREKEEDKPKWKLPLKDKECAE